MTRDSGEFSLALVVGALAGAALALGLRDAARSALDAGDTGGDNTGKAPSLVERLGLGPRSGGGWTSRAPFGRPSPRPLSELSREGRRVAARAIRLPRGVRAVLGNGSRR